MAWMHCPLDGKTVEDIESKAMSAALAEEKAIEIGICHGAFLRSKILVAVPEVKSRVRSEKAAI